MVECVWKAYRCEKVYKAGEKAVAFSPAFAYNGKKE